MIEKARLKGLATTKRNSRIIEGWEGKAKGLLQVLWERGWIDESQLEMYTKRNDNDPKFSLSALMESCLDFATEITQLQCVAKKYDFEVILTPKYHAELAGVGIEYSWGASKACFRKIPLQQRKSRNGFRKSVEESLRSIEREVVRKADRKARCYAQAYYLIEVMQTDQNRSNDPEEQTIITLPLIEKFKTEFRTHRCALNFDTAFCASLVRKE